MATFYTRKAIKSRWLFPFRYHLFFPRVLPTEGRPTQISGVGFGRRMSPSEPFLNLGSLENSDDKVIRLMATRSFGAGGAGTFLYEQKGAPKNRKGASPP